MDFNNLTPVTKSVKVTQKFDLRFTGGKFLMGDKFYSKHNMNNNGLTLYVHDDQVLLSVQSNEDSVFFTGKANSEVKGKRFAYGFLEDALQDQGMLNGEDSVDFKLELAGTNDEGVNFFVVTPVTQNTEAAVENSQSEEAEQTEEAEVIEEELTEEVAEAEEEEVVEEDDDFIV